MKNKRAQSQINQQYTNKTANTTKDIQLGIGTPLQQPVVSDFFSSKQNALSPPSYDVNFLERLLRLKTAIDQEHTNDIFSVPITAEEFAGGASSAKNNRSIVKPMQLAIEPEIGLINGGQTR